MESDRNIFILGIVLIFLGVGSYVIQLHMELRKVRAMSSVRFCEYTLTNQPVVFFYKPKKNQYTLSHLGIR
jgi:hypothetical protein